MLVVKLELWPRGDQNQAEEIGREYIANIGGDAERGDYQAAVCRRGTNDIPREIAAAAYESARREPDLEILADLEPGTRAGRVFAYPRQSYNVWRLVLRTLRVQFPEESPKSTRALQERIDAAIKIGTRGGSVADVLKELEA